MAYQHCTLPFQALTYRGQLQVDGSLRIQDVVKESAIVVVAGEFRLQWGAVF